MEYAKEKTEIKSKSGLKHSMNISRFDHAVPVVGNQIVTNRFKIEK